jgi:hypothetical protein
VYTHYKISEKHRKTERRIKIPIFLLSKQHFTFIAFASNPCFSTPPSRDICGINQRYAKHWITNNGSGPRGRAQAEEPCLARASPWFKLQYHQKRKEKKEQWFLISQRSRTLLTIP